MSYRYVAIIGEYVRIVNTPSVRILEQFLDTTALNIRAYSLLTQRRDSANMYEYSMVSYESGVITVMPEELQEKTITRSAAAKFLDVHESQLRRWETTKPPRLRVAGHVPAGDLPRVLYYESDVLKLKAERDLLKSSSEVPAAPPAL